MNILHLKYAVEVAKAGSINKAAEKLLMGQPNLSRAIRELEALLGISLFERSPRGMTLTPEGEEFLRYAKQILRQVDEVEALFRGKASKAQRFSICVPRSSYISHAFARFSKTLDPNHPAEVFYKETNASRTIGNILNADYKLGIIRYAACYDAKFQATLKDKGLEGQIITSFRYRLVMNRRHPLAARPLIRFEDLKEYTEIAHADPFVPSMPLSEVKKEELPDDIRRRIFVFERASQFDLLAANLDTFMWVSPIPEELLERFGLVEKDCKDNDRVYRDVLIHKKDYALTELDKLFLSEVRKAKEQYL